MLLHVYTKCQGSRSSGSEKKRFCFFTFQVSVKHVTSRVGPFWPHNHYMSKLGKVPLGEATYQMSRLLSFR